MKLIITKEQLEKVVGKEIEEFHLEPKYEMGVCVGLNIDIIPKTEVKEITITGIIKTP